MERVFVPYCAADITYRESRQLQKLSRFCHAVADQKLLWGAAGAGADAHHAAGVHMLYHAVPAHFLQGTLDDLTEHRFIQFHDIKIPPVYKIALQSRTKRLPSCMIRA